MSRPILPTRDLKLAKEAAAGLNAALKKLRPTERGRPRPQQRPVALSDAARLEKENAEIAIGLELLRARLEAAFIEGAYIQINSDGLDLIDEDCTCLLRAGEPSDLLKLL